MQPNPFVQYVSAKAQSLRMAGLWSPEPRLRAKAWLANFDETERPIAALILEHFIFFSSHAVDRMLESGYRAMRDALVQRHGKDVATDLLRRAVFTAVEGEEPNVTDSGKLFCRKLRQLLRLPEERFVEPSTAVKRAASGQPVIFLDDLVGSGDQLKKTWSRKYLADTPKSFSDAYAATRFSATCLALVCTETGATTLASAGLPIELYVSHTLGAQYSIRALPTSPARPDISAIPVQIENLLNRYAGRLQGLPDYMQRIEYRKYGYKELGLLLAFEHSTPDATIPLLWAESLSGNLGGRQWTPLVRRS